MSWTWGAAADGLGQQEDPGSADAWGDLREPAAALCGGAAPPDRVRPGGFTWSAPNPARFNTYIAKIDDQITIEFNPLTDQPEIVRRQL